MALDTAGIVGYYKNFKYNKLESNFESNFFLQAEFNGHWRKGPGATMGEEMEQCFATMSRYGNSIKHENKARTFFFATIIE